MAADADNKAIPVLAAVLGAYMVWSAWQALTVAAGEFPMSPGHYLEMAIDLGMTLVLGGLVVTLFRAPLTAPRLGAIVLAAAGLLGGLVQLGIRFTSDHGWWTGQYPPVVL
jgi:hypothetical protein